jgi:hypothetical protein
MLSDQIINAVAVVLHGFPTSSRLWIFMVETLNHEKPTTKIEYIAQNNVAQRK